jgi:hypothetical protein
MRFFQWHNQLTPRLNRQYDVVAPILPLLLRVKRRCSDALTRCDEVQSQRYACASLANVRRLQMLGFESAAAASRDLDDGNATICWCSDPSVYGYLTAIQASTGSADAMRHSIPKLYAV